MRVIFLITFLSLFSFLGFADTIILKNGRNIEGMITEKGDTYIKVNFQGVELKLYNDEIKEIIPAEKQPELNVNKYKELNKAALIDKVLELSGIENKIQEIYGYAVESYSQQRDKIDPNFFDSGIRIVREVYAATEIYRNVKDYFNQYFEASHMLAVKEFLVSPLAVKISELEKQAAGPEAKNEIEKFANGLVSNPPSLERLDLLKKLDKATHSTDLEIEIALATYKNTIRALDALLPYEKRSKEEDLEKLEEIKKTSLTPGLEKAVSISLLYTYHALTDDEINQYIDFLLSDNGKWFNKISAEALKSALARAAKDIALAFAQSYNDLKSTSSEEKGPIQTSPY